MSNQPKAASKAAPKAAPKNAIDPRSVKRPKVAPFARYKGTSAWTKYHRRVRMYAWHRANELLKQEAAAKAA